MLRWLHNDYHVIGELLDQGHRWDMVVAVVPPDFKMVDPATGFSRFAAAFQAIERTRSTDTPTAQQAKASNYEADDALHDAVVDEQDALARLWPEILARMPPDFEVTPIMVVFARLDSVFYAVEGMSSGLAATGQDPVAEAKARGLDAGAEELPSPAGEQSYGQVSRQVEKHFDEIAAWCSVGVPWSEIAKRLDPDGTLNSNGVKWAFGHEKRTRYQHSGARVAKLMWLQAYQSEVRALLEQGCEWFFVLKTLGYPLDGENIDRLVTELESEFRAMGERAARLRQGASP